VRPFLRSIELWLLVMATVAASLAAVDRLPSWVAGVPHRTWRFDSIQGAERALGARIWLPPFYPADLNWPPTSVVGLQGPPPLVLLTVSSRAGDRDHLQIYQSLTSDVTAPGRLLAPGQRLTSTPVAIGERSGLLDSLFLDGGREVHDLSWEQGGRRITLRYAGPVESLLLMARSMERAHR
jgi:hypothetical protein